MEDQVAKLRAKVRDTKALLKKLELDLRAIEFHCPHEWQPLPNRVEERAGYTLPADGQGSDWRPPCYVPPNRKVFYRRCCAACGKTEETDKVAVHVTQTSKPCW